MEVLKRLEQQARAVEELGRELRGEASYRGVERLVQLTIQALLDLGLMVLSALGASPGDYRDVATSLARLEFLASEDAELMKAMVGLRNVLVHGYARVNREILIEASKRLPEDATRLARGVLSSARRLVKDPLGGADDLVEKLRKALKDRVRLAFIFGSQVKGYSLKADVDVALYFGRRPDPYEVGKLVYDVQEALGREDVDVLVIDVYEDIALAYEAVRGRPVLGEEAEILQLRTKIASQYMDWSERLARLSCKNG